MNPLYSIIDELTANVSLKSHYASLSHRYRFYQNKDLKNNEEHLAYIACRMPATFAACSEVFRRMQEMVPEFRPRSLLDVGSGPGTVVLALREHIPLPEEITLVERDLAFIPIANHFLGDKKVSWQQTLPSGQFDLVTSSYMLSELEDSEQEAMIKGLIGATSSCIVLVDTGTPHGYATLMKAREALINENFIVVAPCPHNKPCPLIAPDWCHFSVRLARSRLHRQLKGGELGYEDEKFCYLVATKLPISHTAHDRILTHPLKRSGHMHVKLCTHEGKLSQEVISKKSEERYKKAKKLEWGDIL